jgi:hypothetical protein
MVYLKEIIRQNRLRLLKYKNIELVAYLSVTSPEDLENYDSELSPDEEVSLKGYKNEPVEPSKVVSIISKLPIKGIDATSNIYKFAGLYLAAKEDLKNTLKEKYSRGDLKQKYFLSKIEPTLVNQLKKDVSIFDSGSISILVKMILGFDDISEMELDRAILENSKNDFDIQTQILLEDLERSLLKIKYINKSSEEVIRDILNNFSNAVQKITKDRRKEHLEFKIEDEYDVQDILYVVLKSIFPTLRDEDPIPKVGAKSTKIDLILRDEKILIEVKMIKGKDSNEIHFIEQLKVDFESYHECKWLKKLFCFVYDPFKKTKDISNFHDLNGNRTKGEHSFNVELIIAN